jgi:hypothetical protein
MATPTLVQHVAGNGASNSQGNTGDGYRIALPNNVQAGNCLILAITYLHGLTPTITDNNGNTWPATPTKSFDNGAGNNVIALFVLPNANAGATTVKTTLGTIGRVFDYKLSEWCNIATSSPANGSAGQSNTGSAVSTGSFTPGNNNANGGNLIYTYISNDGVGGAGNSQTVTSFVPGGSFALLSANITPLAADVGQPSATMYEVQGTSAAINPSITVNGATTDTYTAVAVALQAASAGSPAPSSGIYVNAIHHFNSLSFPTTNGSTFKCQFPAIGNLRFFCTPNIPGSGGTVFSSIVDTDGTYTKVAGTTDVQFWYSASQSADTANMITMTIGTGSTLNICAFQIFDISGAAASPIGALTDTSSATAAVIATTTTNAATLASSNVLHFAATPAAVAVDQFATTPGGNISSNQKVVSFTGTTVTLDANVNTQVVSGATVHFGNQQSNFPPTITPTGSNNLLICLLNNGTGPMPGFYPGAASPTPAAAVYDLIVYIEQMDGDVMDSGNGLAHYYNPNTTPVHWNFLTLPGGVGQGSSVEIKAASAAPNQAPLQPGLLFRPGAGPLKGLRATQPAFVPPPIPQSAILLPGLFRPGSGPLGGLRTTPPILPVPPIPQPAILLPGVLRPGVGPLMGLRQTLPIPPGPVAATAVSLFGFSGAMAKGFNASTGAVPLQAISPAQAKGLDTLTAKAAVAALTAAQAKGQITGSFALAAKAASVAQAKGSAAPTGTVPLAAQSTAQAKGASTFVAQMLLTARSLAAATGRAAGSFALALAARTAAMAKGAAGSSGTVPLAATGAAQAKGRTPISAVANLVSLAATGAAMAKGFAALTGSTALAAMSAAQAKGANAMTAIAALAAQTRAQATGRSALTLPLALAARSAAAAKATAAIAGRTALSATGAAMAAGRAGITAIASMVTLSAVGAAMAKGFAAFAGPASSILVNLFPLRREQTIFFGPAVSTNQSGPQYGLLSGRKAMDGFVVTVAPSGSVTLVDQNNNTVSLPAAMFTVGSQWPFSPAYFSNVSGGTFIPFYK